MNLTFHDVQFIPLRKSRYIYWDKTVLLFKDPSKTILNNEVQTGHQCPDLDSNQDTHLH
jgi:hypothetical protein